MNLSESVLQSIYEEECFKMLRTFGLWVSSHGLEVKEERCSPLKWDDDFQTYISYIHVILDITKSDDFSKLGNTIIFSDINIRSLGSKQLRSYFKSTLNKVKKNMIKKIKVVR